MAAGSLPGVTATATIWDGDQHHLQHHHSHTSISHTHTHTYIIHTQLSYCIYDAKPQNYAYVKVINVRVAKYCFEILENINVGKIFCIVNQL